jgi:periplasmic protein TonB
MRAKLISLFVHVGIVVVLLLFPWRAVHRADASRTEPPPTRLYLPHLAKPDRGRGGMRSLTPATRGQLPPLARRIFILPVPIHENPKPVLILEAGLTMKPVDISDIRSPHFGDPFGGPGPPGRGSGENGVGGPGKGRGRGNHDGDGFESGSPITGPIVGPRVVYHPEPEFSEEARKAKLQGVVVLEIQVDAAGHARIIRVSQPLGLGLDEKAVEAVERWRFRPATRNGRPVPANATIYVNFRLL